MNILVCLSYHRAAGNILAAIEVLAEQHKVYYFCYRRMASTFVWPDPGADYRTTIHERLKKAGATYLGEPSALHSDLIDNYSKKFKDVIRGIKVDLAIFDENLGKNGMGIVNNL